MSKITDEQIERDVLMWVGRFCCNWCTGTHTNWDVWGKPKADELIEYIKKVRDEKSS